MLAKQSVVLTELMRLIHCAAGRLCSDRMRSSWRISGNHGRQRCRQNDPAELSDVPQHGLAQSIGQAMHQRLAHRYGLVSSHVGLRPTRRPIRQYAHCQGAPSFSGSILSSCSTLKVSHLDPVWLIWFAGTAEDGQASDVPRAHGKMIKFH